MNPISKAGTSKGVVDYSTKAHYKTKVFRSPFYSRQDPLNHLQVELIRRHREGKSGASGGERVKRGIHLTINGISAGLRNTG